MERSFNRSTPSKDLSGVRVLYTLICTPNYQSTKLFIVNKLTKSSVHKSVL